MQNKLTGIIIITGIANWTAQNQHHSHSIARGDIINQLLIHC